MTSKDEHNFEELLESAYYHTISEFGAENINPSFKLEFEGLQKAHDAIHEYMLFAPLLVPSKVDVNGWHRKSAFLIYQWEVFHHAHRSLIEALCAYYNVAFILLRATFELSIKGAFWECLSHKRFRDNSLELDRDKKGKEIKDWLNAIIKVAPNVEEEFEQISAGIYDKMETKIEDPKFRLSISTIIRQLDQWGIFNPVPQVEAQIYKEIYGGLSADVHVIPDRIDIGRRLIVESSGLFKQELHPIILREYITSLHKVMDLALVVELNILKEFIEEHTEVKKNLSERLSTLERLDLKYSLERANALLK
jgi:hypothetical protein